MELTLTIFLWIIIIIAITVVGVSFWMTYDLIKQDLDLDFYREDKKDEL